MLQMYDSELNLCCIPVDIEWNKRNQRKKTNDLMNPWRPHDISRCVCGDQSDHLIINMMSSSVFECLCAWI